MEPMTGTGTPEDGTVCGDASWIRSREGTTTLLTVVGDVDFASAGAFAAALASGAAAGRDVTVDMAGVAFVDSAGVDAINLVRRLFEILGLASIVRAPSRSVRRLLDLHQLDGLIERPDATVTQIFDPVGADSRGWGTRVTFG
jgi:anti-anti-sigma factor